MGWLGFWIVYLGRFFFGGLEGKKGRAGTGKLCSLEALLYILMSFTI